MSKIKIFYGPIEINGVWTHSPSKFFNLRGLLNTLGFHISLEPIYLRHRLIIQLDDYKIYECSYSVQLNSDEINQDICKKIIWVIVEARARFSAAKENKIDGYNKSDGYCSDD